MRKILIVFMFSLLITPSLCVAAIDIPEIMCPYPCYIGSPDGMTQACKNVCGDCKTRFSSNGGIRTYTNKTLNWVCPQNEWQTADCSCDILPSTYECMDGWYGTAVNSFTGCKVCPANATCNGGNGSVFVCKAGFYSDGNSCVDCATTGNTRATSAPGSVGITSCYVPSGATGSDASGSFEFTSNCNYSN